MKTSVLSLGLGRTGQEAPALVHVDLGEKRRQPLVVRHDGLDLAVVAQGHRRHRAEMGADFAHQAEAGVDADVQAIVGGNNNDRVRGQTLAQMSHFRHRTLSRRSCTVSTNSFSVNSSCVAVSRLTTRGCMPPSKAAFHGASNVKSGFYH